MSRSEEDLKLPIYMNNKPGGKKQPPPASAAKKPSGSRSRQSSAPAGSKTAHRSQPASKSGSGSQPPRRRKRIRYGRLATVAVVFIGIIAGAIFALTREPESADQLIIGSGQTLPDGVHILGIDVGGDTKTAARSKVEKQVSAIAEEASVTIEADGERYTLDSDDISLAFDIESVMQRAMQYDPSNAGAVDVTTGETAGNITSIFTWNSKALQIALENVAQQFDRSPQEPTADVHHQADGSVSFTFQDGSNGRTFNVATNLEYIETMFSSGDFSFTMEGAYDVLTPTTTAAQLQDGFGLRASYSTNFESDPEDETIQNRVYNIEKAAEMINGYMVAPGEEWSFNGFVGPRTYETGWKGANGIADGKDYTIQAGGGICQVSTTLYNALLCGDVEIVYRRAHSIPSTYVPRGLDATVDSITNIDLKFRNDTGAPLYLYATVEDDPEERNEKTITFYIYGKELESGVTYQTRSEVVEYIHNKDVKYTDDDTIPRGYKVVTIAARRGFVVDAYRDKYINGVLDSSELLYTDNYKGNAEEARRGTASPKYYSPPEGAVPIDS